MASVDLGKNSDEHSVEESAGGRRSPPGEATGLATLLSVKSSSKKGYGVGAPAILRGKGRAVWSCPESSRGRYPTSRARVEGKQLPP